MNKATATTRTVITPGGLPPRRSAIDAMMSPRSIAVIGATESPGRVGSAIMGNLACGVFKGSLYPVNPKYSRVIGMPAYRDVASIVRHVDLAIFATPAASVPSLVEQCAAAGVRGAIVISAGFKEAGAAGVELERQIAEISRATGIRI